MWHPDFSQVTSLYRRGKLGRGSEGWFITTQTVRGSPGHCRLSQSHPLCGAQQAVNECWSPVRSGDGGFPVFQLKKGSEHQAVVQYLEESFAVASLVATGHLAAFSLAAHLNDTFRFDSEKLQVGQGVSLTLKTTEPGVTGFLLAVEGPAAKRTMRQTRKDSETVDEDDEGDPAMVVGTKKKHALSIGDMVTGTIKSIKPTHVVVTLQNGIIGCIHASHILDEVPLGTSPTAKLKVGKTVTARVIGGRDMKTFKYGGFGGWAVLRSGGCLLCKGRVMGVITS